MRGLPTFRTLRIQGALSTRRALRATRTLRTSLQRSWVLKLLVAAALLTVVIAQIVGTSVSALGLPPPNKRLLDQLEKGPLPSAFLNSTPLQLVTNVPAMGTVDTQTSPDPVDLKILVIASDGTEADLAAIRQALDYLGEPYTVYVAAQTPGGLTPDTLYSGNHAYYQGVILTTGDLGYNNNGVWQSALSSTEWQNLWTFEGTFGIRQLSWYTYPTANYGFNPPSASFDSSSNPVSAQWQAAAQPAFSYVNTANALTIQGGWTYLATPLSDGNTAPVIQDAQGNALAAIRTYPTQQNRQNLALTFDSNPYMTYDRVLQYGLINWVTSGTWASNGLFLGERHIYLSPQPDDVFLEDNTWPPGTPCGTNPGTTSTTYRITGTDLQTFDLWQTNQHLQPATANLRISWPFNGWGTSTLFGGSGNYLIDTLTPAVPVDAGDFNWISHTYDHTNLDAISYADAVTEITKNNTVASDFGLANYNSQNMVTPEISGLSNPTFLQAAYDKGIRFLVSDTSRAGMNNPSPNAGIYNTYQSAILEIPRHPTNLYFNVSTPDEWLAEDNCLYPAGANGHVSTYQQLLDRESNVMLGYLLNGDIDPLMFHQPNARAYDSVHSLLSDLLDLTLQKYRSYYTLPILSPKMDVLGQTMAGRMKYNAAGVTASIVPPSASSNPTITITAQQAVTVPVTGLAVSSTSGYTTETYGGQTISYITLSAGQSVTLPLQ